MIKAGEIKKEHEVIEQDLKELETIINSVNLNYPNLLHTLRELNTFWDKHEEKEEEFFINMQKKGFPIPVKKILFTHGKLKKHRESLAKSIQSGSEEKTKEALRTEGKKLIEDVRTHMKQEDWIFYALPKTQ